MERIVVGFDGSPGARGALDEAARMARREHAELEVVTAWHVPGVAYGGAFALPLEDMRRAFAEDAEHVAADGVEAVHASGNGFPVSGVAREGAPAKVLLDAAADADLLVVGSRGHGGFAELLLGSVSHECARHAQCPVLVVHRKRHDAEGTAASSY